MAKNYIQPGNTITLTNTDVTDAAALASGDGYLAGSIFGVAQTDVAVGDDGEFALIGVWALAKVSAQAWTVGQRIYWAEASGECTTTASSNKLIGVAVEAADNPSATGKVRLSGAFTI
jgi:predicted RecA/RadA family phage recombinase